MAWTVTWISTIIWIASFIIAILLFSFIHLLEKNDKIISGCFLSLFAMFFTFIANYGWIVPLISLIVMFLK